MNRFQSNPAVKAGDRQMAKKYFGTDGIRGRVGEHPITADFMLRLGWAAGKVFAREGRGRIIIGKDTRVSGYMFESALEAGLVSAGIDVLLLGPMPTPAIAYLTRTFNASAGIVISASHNAFHDNGIKFFSSDGAKLDDDVEHAIEAELENDMEMVSSDQIGKVSRVDDAAGRYIEFCKSCFPADLNLRGLKIVVDCAHGATYHIAPSVLSELGAEVLTLGTEPDGFNINAEVGSTYPGTISARVVETSADLGIALDGDGDRVIMVDHEGVVVDGDDVHARTASEVFEIDREAVTSEQRSVAKAVNFGVIYGQTAFGLAKTLGIPQGKAARYIKKYFERIPGVNAYMDELVERAKRVGEAETILGRKRRIPELGRRGPARAYGERIARNTPIQGSAADILKVAMIAVERALKDTAWAKMVLTVHDELIFEVDAGREQELIDVVRPLMEEAVALDVPLVVDAGWGQTWAETKG